MARNSSRRSLLRSTAAVVGIGIAGGFAGCNAPSDPSGEENTAGYRRLLPAPSNFGGSPYYFESVYYRALERYKSHFSDAVYRDYAEQSLFTEVGISAADITTALFVGPVESAEEPAVVLGEFTEAEVSDHLTANGYEQSNSDVGEYSVYRGTRTIAVRDGRLLFSPDGTDQIEAIRGVQTGEQPSYPETNDTMQTLLDEVDTGTFVYGVAHDPLSQSDHDPVNGTFAGMLGTAYADVVSGETTAVTIVYLFESADDVDSAAIDAYTSGDLFDAYRSVSSTQDGRTVTITGELATSDLYDETI